MIKQRNRRYESVDVRMILDTIEEFSGNRYSEKELREKDCWVHNQNTGGGHCIIKLAGRGDGMYLRTYWYAATRRECRDLIQETAEALGPNFVQDYESDLFAAVWEEYTAALDEADFNSIEEILTLKNPDNEDNIIQFLNDSCEEQLSTLDHIAERDYKDILSAWEDIYGDTDDLDEVSDYEDYESRKPGRKIRRMESAGLPKLAVLQNACIIFWKDVYGGNYSKSRLIDASTKGIASVRLNGLCDLEFSGQGEGPFNVLVKNIRTGRELGSFKVTTVSNEPGGDRIAAVEVFLHLRDDMDLLENEAYYLDFFVENGRNLRARGAYVIAGDMINRVLHNERNLIQNKSPEISFVYLKDWDIVNRDMSHPVFAYIDGKIVEETKLNKTRRTEARAKKAKMIFIPKSNGSIETVKQDTENSALQQKIGCDLIDMIEVGQSRKAPNIAYDFIIDDEGSFAGRDNINNFSILGYQMHKLSQPLYGNILMCAIDLTTGEIVDIPDIPEAKRILKDLWFL